MSACNSRWITSLQTFHDLYMWRSLKTALQRLTSFDPSYPFITDIFDYFGCCSRRRAEP